MNFDDNNLIEKPNKVIITNQLDGKSNNPSIISLVLGIISIIFFWAFICSIITGCISLAKKRGSSNMAITGIVLSILGFLFNVAFLFIFIITLFIN